MTRFNDILDSINQYVQAAQKTYKGKKRSDLKDSDFLFPETRSFPIVTPQDIPDAISNFGRMKGNMSYETFLNKLYNMAKRKGPQFVEAFPKSTKDKLGIKNAKAEEDMDDYKESYYGMSVGSLKAIMSHAQEILQYLDNPMVQQNLTAPHLQGMIAVTEDHMRSIHDFVMFVETDDDDEDMEDETETESKVHDMTTKKKRKKVKISDLPHYEYQYKEYPGVTTTPAISADRPGLWENIRKKKEREGKKYRPAKPGDKDRPDPKQWKRLTKD
jgi:hypothetical protein